MQIKAFWPDLTGVDASKFEVINKEAKRRVMSLTTEQLKKWYPPELFTVAKRLGLRLTLPQLIESLAGCGFQSKHRDVFTEKGLTKGRYRLMVAQRLLTPISVFWNPTGEGGHLYVCPGTQYIGTKAHTRLSKRRGELRSRVLDKKRQYFRRIEYGPDEMLFMNSGLWHYGGKSSKKHRRLFVFMELGKKGIAITHRDRDGMVAIDVLAEED